MTRIDLWLKYVCLMKHRIQATDACRGGHVKINGQRVKPATTVRQGDVVEFAQGRRFRRVVVQAIPESQASKEVARAMYIDQTPEPVHDLPAGVFRERGRGRPTKRERRDLEKLKR